MKDSAKRFATEKFDRVSAALTRRIRDELSGSLQRRGHWDVVSLAHHQAGLESAQFYTENLLNCTEFDDKFNLLRHAVGLANPGGLFLEFGVATGRSINIIAESAGHVYGFDSFEGLPEDWYGKYRRGFFARETLPEVRNNVSLIVGWFSDTLPGFLAENAGPVSFLHVDSDLYSSAAFVFTELRDRIQSGTVILFDEYFNYPGWKAHEHRAFMEFIEATGLKFRYDSFMKLCEQVCVVIE